MARAATGCRRCGAAIRFLSRREGGVVVVDAERLTEYLGPQGEGPELTLITEDGATVRGRQGSVLTPESSRTVGYQVHVCGARRRG